MFENDYYYPSDEATYYSSEEDDEDQPCTVRLGNIKVSVVAGNIWEQQVHVIVNSTSKTLELNRGISSNCLLEAAGATIQSECKRKYPKGIKCGDIAVTGPGKLICRKIYHVALERYQELKDEQVLAEVVYNCMITACQFRTRKMAFPALGTGRLNYTPQNVAEIMFDRVDEFAQDPNSTLTDVLFVVYSKDINTLNAFKSTAQRYTKLGGARISHQMNQSYCCKFGNLTVKVVVGKLTEVKVDVLVCRANRDLKLQQGGQTKHILNAAGQDIQIQCNSKYPQGIKFGEIAATKGCNLRCGHVYFTALPEWGTPSPDPLKTLEDSINDCLLMANEYSTGSIAFPTLGTGTLNFPTQTAISTFIKCLAQFDRRFPDTTLKHIIIVIYDKAKDYMGIAKVLRGELGKPLPVVKDLLQKGGQRIQDELDHKYPNGIKPGDIARTNGHHLNCKEVYHCILVTWYSKTSSGKSPEDIMEETVLNMLLKANGLHYSTIAFPALGTGFQKFPPDITACHMINAIKQFTVKVKKPNLKEIRIVLFGGSSSLQKMEKAFLAEIKQLSGQLTVVIRLHPTTDCLTEESPENYADPVAVSYQRGEAPQRGSAEFCKWMHDLDGRPPSYWTKFTAASTLKEWNIQTKETPCCIENVDTNTYNSISAAFLNTLRQQTKRDIKIIRILRIENTFSYLKYFQESQRLFRKAYVRGFRTLSELSRYPVLSTNYLNETMRRQIYWEINEFYVFHATRSRVVDLIVDQGPDARLAKQGRLGMGIYGAEKAEKSHAYASPNENGELSMFMLRMCLGDAFITGDENKLYTRAPCRICSSARCTQHSETFDSVVAEGGVFNHREFVVYDRAQCYPEYLIVYKA